ncbi:MAG: cell wall hydrolase [Bacillota bacterium]|nr:cell wall hydrolase [Bacillota bacterium]
MKNYIIVLICFFLLLSDPLEAKAITGNPVSEDSSLAKARVEQKDEGVNSEEDMDLEEEENLRGEFDEKDIDLLARLVYAEAKGEPYKGKVAVAASVMNRIDSPLYPNSVSDVVYQKNFGFQYCPVRNGQINQKADEASFQAVEEALKGNDPTNGALSFYNPSNSSNRWIRSRPYCISIGRHIFVK